MEGMCMEGDWGHRSGKGGVYPGGAQGREGVKVRGSSGSILIYCIIVCICFPFT